ncbi:MAG: hypothetical protein O2856_07975 [Planctomycetota bacterium]|nr:hypothetical protein [Planctomycetota bacterium]
MRYQNLLYCAIVTLIILHGTMLFAVPQQNHSSPWPLSPEIAAVAVGSDRTQSPFDAMGFDSGLWRSEYLRPPAEDTDDAQKASDPSPTANQLSELASLSSVPEPNAKMTTLAAFGYSDSLVPMPIDIPTVTETSGFHTIIASEEDVDTTMSDWENSNANSAGNATLGLTASGPSATSAILGVVGILIVAGAYVSSGKQNR